MTQSAEQATQLGDLDAEVLRLYGHEVVDWIVDYLSSPQDHSVLPRTLPGEVSALLPSSPPVEAEDMGTVLADFKRLIVPNTTHWNHPGFMAYFSTSASTPGILGEMLTAALNVNAMLWRTSPAATELEEVTLEWLKQMLGLPARFDGSLVDGASMANFLALAAAREHAGLGVREQGMAGRDDLPELVVYTSAQAHSSMEKAALTAGTGQGNVRLIATDSEFRMDAAALSAAIARDLAQGRKPLFIGATVGTTSTSSIDPVPAIAEVARRHGIWLHVDGAYGGMAAMLPEKRWVLDGLDLADSFVTNPHKWMFTPVDCSAFYTTHPQALKRAFSLVPDYLRTNEGDAGIRNYMDYGVQLGRRFRALKLWMVIRGFGVSGLQARIREHIRIAAELARSIEQSADFELLAPVPLSVVCFRYHPSDVSSEDALAKLNADLMTMVNDSGEVLISPTALDGRYSLRLQVSQLRTEERHVLRAWELLQSCAAKLARQ